jgi:hypothetical protein
VTAAVLEADSWTQGPVTAKDAATHKTVCSRPVPSGLSWQTRCSCGCTLHRHDHATHAKILNPQRTRKCTGRSNYGACRTCPCAGFKPQPAAQETS